MTGSWTLLRFILRRDRVRIPIWILAILITVVGTASIFPDTYPSDADRQARATLMENPAMRMMLGPLQGAEDYTFGAMMASEMLGMMMIVVSLMSIFMVVRHTRAEEETGRAELVRSSVTGRYAGMTAVIVAVAGLNLLIGLLTAVGLTATLPELDLTGSLVFGAALAVTGISFGAIALVSVQLNEFSRAASGMAVAIMIGTYVVRGFGDMLENWLMWAPISGPVLQSAPYVDNLLWPLLIPIAIAGVLIPLAFWLSDQRDVAAALRPPRPGPATASPRLGMPFGLLFRLQRGSLLSWGIGLLLFGMAYGSVVNEVGEQYADNPMVSEYFAALGLDVGELTESIVAMIAMFMALLVSVYAVGTVTRLRGEETSLRAENILATAVSRIRWAGESMVFGIVTSTFILGLTGVGAATFFALDSGSSSDFWMVLGAVMNYAPAIWLAVALAVAVFGIIPQAMSLAWFVPAYGFFALMIGPLLGLPGWLYNISPFEYVPRVPSVDFDPVPLAVMTVIALGLILAGLIGIRRRDLSFV